MDLRAWILGFAMSRPRTLLALATLLAITVVACDAGRPTGSPSPTVPPAQWPVAGHDPQRTSIGSARGPIDPVVVPGWPRRGTGAGTGLPVIGSDGTLYTAIGDGVSAWLPNGTERGNGWPVAMAPGDAPRVGIGSNDAVFVARGSLLTSLRPISGTAGPGWPVTAAEGIVSVMVVTGDTVYVGWVTNASTKVDAYTFAGKLQDGWPVEFPKEAFTSIAVAPDGTIYLAGRKQLYALGPDGNARPGWPFQLPDQGPAAALTVGQDGTLFAAVLTADNGNALYAVAPDGAVRPGWPYHAEGSASSTLLGLGPDGMLYDGSGSALHALGTHGGPRLRWKTDASVRTVDALAIGADGTLYFGGMDPGGRTRLWARGADGKDLPGWPLGLPLQGAHVSGMAIGGNGVLYLPTSDGHVLAYIDQSAGSSPSPSGSSGSSRAIGSGPPSQSGSAAP